MDIFLFKDLLKLCKNAQIGFVLDEIKPYKKAWASIRIKCYDVIKYFDSINIATEIYKPFKKYPIVVFVKTSTDKSAKKAERLKSSGYKIIYNAYCDHLTDPTRNDSERINTIRILQCSDIVVVCTEEQKQQFEQFHKKVVLIYESIPEEYFSTMKEHTEKECPTLIYCGYAHKAKDTLAIKNVLKKLIEEEKCKILYLCDKDPKIDDLQYEYLQYDQSIIQEQLLQGDIAIAPRKTDGIELLSHSFTKVALTGAIGLPTVASPVPSYLGSPVVICQDEEQWYIELSKLIESYELREKKGKELRDFIVHNYSLRVIGEQYRKLFIYDKF